MVKLNAALMVVIVLAVVASALFLADESTSAAGRDDEQARRLLRKLADPDPDVRREGEEGLVAMGPRATLAIREAARSSDRELARRAARLLDGSPPAPELPRPASRAAETAAAPPAPESEDPVRILIECGEWTIRSGDAVAFYVRLRNDGPRALLLARDRGTRYSRFACFEATDEKGRSFEFAAEPAPAAAEGTEVVVVRPGETLDLYAGQGDGRTVLAARFPEPGAWQVRFIYQAGADAYREVVKGRPDGSPIPPARLASNAVALQILE
jgi:hypothetical protein